VSGPPRRPGAGRRPRARSRPSKRPPAFSRGNGEDAFFTRVYATVRTLPRGRVATYGQIALLCGVPRGARAVGWALRVLDAARHGEVPWHRVVGAGGRISPRAGAGPLLQRRRLRAEGVRFKDGRVDLSRHALLA
jgi:methylated-DNA-protein-cysteine methyltransferase related protein